MQVELGPHRLRQRPLISSFPLSRILNEQLDGGLIHDPRVDSFKPVVEPAKGFVMVLIHGAVKIVGGANRELLRPLPALVCLKVTGEMQGMHGPAATEIARYIDIDVEADCTFLMQVRIEIVQDILHDEHVAALVGILEDIHKLRVDVDLRVLKGLFDLFVKGLFSYLITVFLPHP